MGRKWKPKLELNQHHLRFTDQRRLCLQLFCQEKLLQRRMFSINIGFATVLSFPAILLTIHSEIIILGYLLLGAPLTIFNKLRYLFISVNDRDYLPTLFIDDDWLEVKYPLTLCVKRSCEEGPLLRRNWNEHFSDVTHNTPLLLVIGPQVNWN